MLLYGFPDLLHNISSFHFCKAGRAGKAIPVFHQHEIIGHCMMEHFPYIIIQQVIHGMTVIGIRLNVQRVCLAIHRCV